MERRSWPWRKKAGAKLKRASFDSHRDLLMPAISFKAAYEEPPSRIDVPQQEETPRIPIENARVVEAISLRQQAEDNAKNLTEKLSVALEDMTAKEALVKQHCKVAQEAVSGWEKAEAEAVSLKRELESSAQQRSLAEDRVAQMDGALRECMKQVRHAREEQEEKIQEAILRKTREWDQVKADLDAKQAELARRLMESNAENSAITKSLHERATMIMELKEAKAKAETDSKVLQVKVQSLEKEISALKYEMHVLNKELEIRNEEREYSKKSSDAAHKQHLENVKKIAQLESECQRLRNLVRKKLPGPAALAQMRMEVEGKRRPEIVGDAKKRSRSLSKSASPAPAPSNSRLEIEMLTERMQSMEEETKLLKEALAKRDGELNSSRHLCARTASKLSVAEDQLESLQGTPRSRNGVDLQPETSVASRSEDCNGGTDDQEVSCAESWASALMGELAHFKKDKAKHASRLSMESCNFDAAIEEFLEAEREASARPPSKSVVEISVVNQRENATQTEAASDSMPEDRKTLKIMASKEAELQAANLMCKDVNLKLSVVEEQLAALKCEGDAICKAQVQEILKSLMKQVSKLDKILDEMRIAVASMDDSENEDNHPNSKGQNLESSKAAVDLELPDISPPPVANLRFVLCKLIFLVELLRVDSCIGVKNSNDGEVTKESNLEEKARPTPNLEEKTSSERVEAQMQGLLTAKESLLKGKGNLLEVLLRLGVVMSGLCSADASELERVLSKAAEEGTLTEASEAEELDCAGKTEGGDDANGGDAHHYDRENKELEKKLGLKEEELQSTRSELEETNALVTDLRQRVTDLEAEETKAAAEAEKSAAELRKLQVSVATLTIDLADQRKLYDQALATCQNLEHQLSKPGYVADGLEPRKVVVDEDVARSRKERDVAAAKEKLAECQRSIQVLEKQLTALSSPPAHSRMASFDSTSLDLEQTPPEDALHQHHRRRSSQNQDAPRFTVLSMYNNSPPYNTTSSPDVSPPANNHKSVRTSLASSINLASSISSSPTYPATKHPPKPGSSSSFSRFFSKSKYHR